MRTLSPRSHMLAAVSVDWRVSLLTPPHTVISASIFNQIVVAANLREAHTYLLVVLYAHRQSINKDGNHDSSAEVSAANNKFQFSSEPRPAALPQPLLWLRQLRVTEARAATVTRAVTVTRVAVALLFRLLVNIFAVTKLVVVDAVRAYRGLSGDFARQQ